MSDLEATGDDPFTWLEDVDGAKALDWVRTRDAETVQGLASGPLFEKTRSEILEVLDSEARIPFVQRQGRLYYNFWRDQAHARGIWRRTTLASYSKASPDWEIVLDLDALAAKESENWVWHGADCLQPAYRRCLIQLSRGGADASVVREFDLETKSFVPDGFQVPEAKTNVSWRDADSLFVGTDFGPGSMTHSGYPRVVKIWRRGTSLETAETIYEGQPADVSVSAYRDHTPGFEREFIHRGVGFFTSERYLRDPSGHLTNIDIPLDAELSVQREWMLVKLRTDWTVGGITYRGGALVAARFDDYLQGKRSLTVLFQPTKTVALAGYGWTRHHLILESLADVSSHIEILTPHGAAWQRVTLMGLPPLSTARAFGTDADVDDEFFTVVEGFLAPSTLSRGDLAEGHQTVELKHAPSFFDAAKEQVAQHFATSKDGTRIPYFVIGPQGASVEGGRPTLLTGYGGFEVSLTPAYDGGVGRAWLAKGGVYVVANIRGGGEYGPAWHQAALRENRLRAYEDFAAVAQDLVARGVTSRPHLGIKGGSNGGLLVGNMLTLYPELLGAVVCGVPLLDMRRYTHLSAGASWIAEYGDPDKPEEWAFIRRFSPYENASRSVSYPPVLFTTSTRDDRVGPVHARKMAAKLLDLGADVSFYENMEGGHGAAANNQQAAFMSALAYTFLWKKLAPGKE